ncbi:MAG TPA: malate:quinone oxidoreductase, partial [Methylophilaceae bacterium]|nr:malate:quinone oxidoreductase [Methylophilaceae bacterium]
MKHTETDVLLVGGGIMSATLGVLLQALDPTMKITMIEQLSDVALESTDALNNAGTGHAGYCELNYTPQAQDGSISTQRALEINAA